MARGTDFGGVHSHADLHLVQAKVEVQPAKPKLNFIDIPGADGSKDFSESPAGRAVFETREITWTFKLYPGDHWATKYTQVSNAINGRACKITLDDDPNYYYLGRVAVDSYEVDSILHTITVVATCQPYKLKQKETTVSANLALSGATANTIMPLRNGRRPVVPTITVSAPATLYFGGNTFSVNAGTHKLLDIELVEGVNSLQAMATVATGPHTIKVVYQEGDL